MLLALVYLLLLRLILFLSNLNSQLLHLNVQKSLLFFLLHFVFFFLFVIKHDLIHKSLFLILMLGFLLVLSYQILLYDFQWLKISNFIFFFVLLLSLLFFLQLLKLLLFVSFFLYLVLLLSLFFLANHGSKYIFFHIIVALLCMFLFFLLLLLVCQLLIKEKLVCFLNQFFSFVLKLLFLLAHIGLICRDIIPVVVLLLGLSAFLLFLNFLYLLCLLYCLVLICLLNFILLSRRLLEDRNRLSYKVFQLQNRFSVDFTFSHKSSDDFSDFFLVTFTFFLSKLCNQNFLQLFSLVCIEKVVLYRNLSFLQCSFNHFNNYIFKLLFKSL